MRKWVLVLTMATLASGCASMSPRPQGDEAQATLADITRLEDEWTRAANNGDTSFMEEVMAPEYVLVGAGGPRGANITSRKDWMRVWLDGEQLPYEAKVLDVVVAGDTAVGTLLAHWRRKSVLRDTWSRRNGRWQLIFRHSAPRP
jgi:ketosteroid isomerase-like protein